MLLTANGHLAPPQAAAQRLAQISPRLRMDLVPSVGGAYWAIKEAWPDRDPRRERIQRQEIPASAAFDIVTTFRATIPADDVVAWIDQHYGPRQATDPVREAAAQTDATESRLAQHQAAKVDAAVARAEDQHKRTTAHQRRVLAGGETAHPMVAGFGDKPARGRRKSASNPSTTE